MHSLITHKLATLDLLAGQLYDLAAEPCYPSAVSLARQLLFELSYLLANAELPESNYQRYLKRLNRIEVVLQEVGRGKVRGIRRMHSA